MKTLVEIKESIKGYILEQTKRLALQTDKTKMRSILQILSRSEVKRMGIPDEKDQHYFEQAISELQKSKEIDILTLEQNFFVINDKKIKDILIHNLKNNGFYLQDDRPMLISAAIAYIIFTLGVAKYLPNETVILSMLIFAMMFTFFIALVTYLLFKKYSGNINTLIVENKARVIVGTIYLLILSISYIWFNKDFLFITTILGAIFLVYQAIPKTLISGVDKKS